MRFIQSTGSKIGIIILFFVDNFIFLFKMGIYLRKKSVKMAWNDQVASIRRLAVKIF